MHKKIFKKRYVIVIGLIVAILAGYLFYVHQFEVLPLPAYYLLTDLPAPQPTDSIVVVSPHPDDEALGAAGFIKRAHDIGAAVAIIIATDGNKHGLKFIRHQETIKAMAILGIAEPNIQFLDFPDGNLKQHQFELEKKLADIIPPLQPTIILSTHPDDVHPDHTVVGRAVNNFMRNTKIHPHVYQYLVHYHRYPRPEGFHATAFLLPPVRLLSFDRPWRKFALTVEEQNAKNEAILQYKSQLSRKNPILRGLMLSFIRQNELFIVVN